MPIGEVIKVTNLWASHNSIEAIRDITFCVGYKDFVGLVGPNGSGKTTLIKTILGLLTPFKGTVALFDQELSVFKDWHRVGYLPQRINMVNPYFPCTVREVLSIAIAPNVKKQHREAMIENSLNLLEIQGLGHRLIGELSGGEQQRVFIARALINKPDLLILDEPTAAIDPETRDNFYRLLRDLNQRDGVTIILVTHDTGTIGEHANKLLYLDKEVLFYGSFEEFCQSEHMERVFGHAAQHIICHKH